MQWKRLTSNIGNTAFGLWSNGQKMLTLAYKPKTNYIYLESADGEKRQFQYKMKGLLKNKLILQNEYGAELGKITREGKEKYIEVDGNRYYLNIKSEKTKQVELIDERNQQPVVVCSFEDGYNETTNNSLLMVMCFYFFKPRTNSYDQAAIAV